MAPKTPIVFDVETTGTDLKKDQVIELCVQCGTGADATSSVWRFKPDVPMTQGAFDVHGISLDDLKNEPAFADIAEEIFKTLDAYEVWIGYNVGFDIQMLQAEFKRAGCSPLELDHRLIVDPFRLWQQCEPRTLQVAHKRFTKGTEFTNAHSAKADVAATGHVLNGMIDYFKLPSDWDELAAISEPDRKFWIGPSNHLKWNDNGKATIAFGKHSGKAIVDVVKSGDVGYLKWILQKDFPNHVHQICSQALALETHAFRDWMSKEYSPPSS